MVGSVVGRNALSAEFDESLSHLGGGGGRRDGLLSVWDSGRENCEMWAVLVRLPCVPRSPALRLTGEGRLGLGESQGCRLWGAVGKFPVCWWKPYQIAE
jgi:hypothetical protein